MISVICVYNQEKQFQNQLLSSLKKQRVDYELIALDNRGGRFVSAAAAYNFGAAQAKGDILIFSHQDIYLKSEEELQNFASYISTFPEGTILGAAGVKEKDKKNISNFTSGSVLKSELRWNLDSPQAVSSVDEGLFGMLKSTWEIYRFNERICDGWDLYAVEMCLNARKQHHEVYVVPLQFHHFSDGKISIVYMKCLKQLARAYRNDFKYIWTTCYKVSTNRFYMEGLYLSWCLNRIVRHRSLGADGSLNQ